jgi:hypothetical protein
LFVAAAVLANDLMIIALAVRRRNRSSPSAMCGRLRVGKGFSSRMQQWSARQCGRPVTAIHVTAGDNALRGSDPCQLRAFDNAVAEVGCLIAG